MFHPGCGPSIFLRNCNIYFQKCTSNDNPFAPILKIEEREKIAGVMKTSLEQKDGRMNEMQRKIEV